MHDGMESYLQNVVLMDRNDTICFVVPILKK